MVKVAKIIITWSKVVLKYCTASANDLKQIFHMLTYQWSRPRKGIKSVTLYEGLPDPNTHALFYISWSHHQTGELCYPDGSTLEIEQLSSVEVLVIIIHPCHLPQLNPADFEI